MAAAFAPKTLVSGAGAGLNSLAQSIMQFLQFYGQQQDRDLQKQDRQKQLAMDQQRIDLEGKRVALEDQSQRTNAAGQLRSNLQGGSIDDPVLAKKIADVFKGTPYEATLSQKQSLPSTSITDAGTQQVPGQDFSYLQPTTQESLAAAQAKRDQTLMDMEQARAKREADEAPIRARILQNEAATSDPTYLERTLKEKYGLDLQQLKEQFNLGKKTSFADDMNSYYRGLDAVDKITDPRDRAAAEMSMKAVLGMLQQKYPQLAPNVGPQTPDATPDCDMKNIDPVTGKCKTSGATANGPGIIDSIKNFLSGGSTPKPTATGGSVRIY